MLPALISPQGGHPPNIESSDKFTPFYRLNRICTTCQRWVLDTQNFINTPKTYLKLSARLYYLTNITLPQLPCYNSIFVTTKYYKLISFYMGFHILKLDTILERPKL